jgi:uncharacterized protein (TIGR02302 family)
MPEIALVMPADSRSGRSETTRDLTEHPLAGLPVKVTLIARDGAEQEGKSETVDMRLPERPFAKPLARALVEQRRNLAADKTKRPEVQTALEALGFAPEYFMKDMPVAYLGLVAVTNRLNLARTDDRLRVVLQMLWNLALYVEDGDLSNASEALRQARENLNKALEQNADEKEISRLTKELREALDHYMAELAQRFQTMPQQTQIPNGMQMQNIDPNQMKSMMDRIEELARMGSHDAARQMLSQLQNMLENLQSAKPFAGNQGQQQQNPYDEAMEKLGDMVRRQQDLMDQTYQATPDAQMPRALPKNEIPFDIPGFGTYTLPKLEKEKDGADQGESNENGDNTPPSLEELQKRQQALQKELEALQKQLQKQGAQTGKMKEAGKEMQDAAKALGNENGEQAVVNQSLALEALRDGAGELAQQAAQAAQNGQGQGQQLLNIGPSGQPQLFSNSGDTSDRDPLGRPRRNNSSEINTSKVPTTTDVQRSRQVLEEIRRRLGENFRPSRELDYLERLLERF